MGSGGKMINGVKLGVHKMFVYLFSTNKKLVKQDCLSFSKLKICMRQHGNMVFNQLCVILIRKHKVVSVSNL
jgi:hypothetical protein